MFGLAVFVLTLFWEVWMVLLLRSINSLQIDPLPIAPHDNVIINEEH